MKKLTITVYVEENRPDLLKEDLQRKVVSIQQEMANGNEWGQDWELTELN